MEGTARFWNRMADGYAVRPVPDEAIYERKLAMTRALFTPASTVLEIGCGTGSTAIAHAPFVRRIRATDISDRMIEIARGKAGEADVANVDFVAEAAIAASDEATRYDIVLAHSILHLLPDWRETLRTLHDRLVPGGRLVASTLPLDDEVSWLRWPARAGRLVGLLPTLVFFDRRELEAEIRAAGFFIEESWKPGPRRGVFHIARREGDAA